jgi:peptide/nickel transport system permease protein
MKQNTKNWSIWLLLFWLFVAIFKDIIANECPLFCNINGQVYFPAFRTLFTTTDEVNWQAPFDEIYREGAWHSYPYQSALFPFVPFRAGQTNRNAIEKPPLFVEKQQNHTFTHYLGTDTGGRDVAAGIVTGARISLLTGFIAISIAALIGIFLGGMAGFYGDNSFQISRGRKWLTLLSLPIATFFAFIPNQFYLAHIGTWQHWAMTLGFFVSIIIAFQFLAFLLKKITYFDKKTSLSLDFWVQRSIEVFNSIPRLMLIICLIAMASIAKPSLYFIIAIIGTFSWTGIARLLRGELLRIRELPYIQAARAAGFNDWYILWHHALPNAFRPIGIALAIGCANAIMLEASLGFLGFSSVDTGASWGSLLNTARGNFSMWWLAIFPGLAIFSVILALNSVLKQTK